LALRFEPRLEVRELLVRFEELRDGVVLDVLHHGYVAEQGGDVVPSGPTSPDFLLRWS
jgi:hypothetical protein